METDNDRCSLSENDATNLTLGAELPLVSILEAVCVHCSRVATLDITDWAVLCSGTDFWSLNLECKK